MRRLTIALALPALAACASNGVPLLEEELRAPGARAEPTRVVSDGRAALPDRMSEIRAERRRAPTVPSTLAAPAAPSPVVMNETLPTPPAVLAAPAVPSRAYVPPADFPRAEAAPSQPAPLPAGPDASSVPADPYFAALDDDALEATAPRVGAPARVGAAPAPRTADRLTPHRANDAPFALRGDEAPEVSAPIRRRAPEAVPAAPAGQPTYPLDPIATDASPEAPVLPTAQAGQSEGFAEAYVADPAGTLGIINGLRARYGLDPLRYDPVLSAVALAHARDLADRGEVASTGIGGEGVLSRARAMGAEPTLAGSLVAGGYADVPSALATWRGDKAQRDRLLLSEADTLGLALVEDRRSPFRYYIEAIVAAQ